jgi:Tfp pilus assembly protein PilN
VLRTNLSTRPFYNERAVHWGLGVAAIAILALTLFNVTRVLALSQQQSTLAAAAERDEAQARALSAEAATVRASIDQKALEQVVHAAQEANDIIDQRTFSWTELLNHIERTLPAGVMLTSVAPHADKGRFHVAMVVRGRSVETVDDFIEKLEGTHAFTDLSPNTERVTENALYEVSIIGDYHPGVAPPAAAKTDPPSPEASDAPSAPDTAADAASNGASTGGAGRTVSPTDRAGSPTPPRSPTSTSPSTGTPAARQTSPRRPHPANPVAPAATKRGVP